MARTLDTLSPGEQGRVAALDFPPAMLRRLRELGFLPGSTVTTMMTMSTAITITTMTMITTSMTMTTSITIITMTVRSATIPTAAATITIITPTRCSPAGAWRR